MKKIALVMLLTILVLASPALCADDHEYHFIIWCRDGSTKYWYVAASARYDEHMSSWVLTDAARLDGDRIVRLLNVIVPPELLISAEHAVAVQPEDLAL